MDVTSLVGIIVGGAGVLGACLSIWTFFQSPSKKNAEDIAALREGFDKKFNVIEERVVVAEKGIGTLDTIIKQLPDKDSFHVLDKGLTEVRGKIDTISVTINAAEHSLNRIEGFLIDSAKGARN